MTDETHMRAALSLARRHLGNTWPNPSVGCVIVKNERVVGRGSTAPGGRPHAEPQALAMAGEAARGATAYVTLEPCSHHGRTPPCADALIAAGIARVVVAATDPDPRVDGNGLERLRRAGVAVSQGLLQAEAEAVNAGFFSRVVLGRPLVTLKLATTLDGRLATKSGESQWITGPAARREAHALRGRHDGVMVGVGTLLADDPRLTCRLPAYKHVPMVRVIADSHLRTRATATVVATAREEPTWFLVRDGTDPERIRRMADAGARVIEVPAAEPGIDLGKALASLAASGMTRVLVEGGAQMAAALLRADLVDRLAWFHAPSVMGGDGWPAAQPFGVDVLSAMPRFRRIASRALGDDMLTELHRSEPCSQAS
jgi:diaminohydroxyphosphoribosylaminopyrimidine deaminase/5-amino-6-(5-phosphoribosylamino)uracil reductase